MNGILESFTTHFIVRKRNRVFIATFKGLTQGMNESLESYINWFTQVGVEVQEVAEGLKY